MARIGGGYSCVAPAAYNQENSHPRTMLPFNCPHAVAHASIIERYVFKRIVNNQPKMKLPTDTSCVQYTQRYVDGRCAGSLHTATYLHTNCLSTYVPLTLYHSLFLLFSKKKYAVTQSMGERVNYILKNYSSSRPHWRSNTLHNWNEANCSLGNNFSKTALLPSFVARSDLFTWQ